MPVTVGAAAAAAQFGMGALQSIFSGKKKAEKDLEGYAKSYAPDGSILDLYNKSLAKYSSNPYTSQFYQNAQNNIQRNLTTGIGASQDRRGGLGTIGALTQGADDASAKAASQAEQQQSQALQQLGVATRMKAEGTEKKYDLLYNLKALKAGAANQQKAAGLKNMFGALGSASMLSSGVEGGGWDTGNGDGTSFMKRKRWGQ